MSEKTMKLDPRLVPIHRAVSIKLYEEKVDPLLRANKLVGKDGEYAELPLTDDSFELLLSSVFMSTKVALCLADIAAPVGFDLDEIRLADNILEAFGQAALFVKENCLTLSFDGEGALFRHITVPLDIEQALAQKSSDNIVDVQIGLKPRITNFELINIEPSAGKIL